MGLWITTDSLPPHPSSPRSSPAGPSPLGQSFGLADLSLSTSALTPPPHQFQPPTPPNPRSLAGQHRASQEPNGFVENGRQQMFPGFPARAAEPYWTLPHPLPNAARDNLGPQPGLAQEGDKGVAAKAWVQMSPSLA